MSDQDEVPDLSSEAKTFLERHERTGEPPAAGLERGKQRLAALTQGAVPARQLKRRSLLPPEVTAAAAVVAIVLGVQVLYLALRPDPIVVTSPEPAQPHEPLPLEVAQSPDRDAKALVRAWRAGDLEGANRLASKDCSSEVCRPLASDVARAVGLARRLDALSPEELDELGLLDAKLADGRSTPLGRMVAKRQNGMGGNTPLSPAARTEAEQLFAEAQDERRAKNFERAAVRLEKCMKIAPSYAPCYRQAGSVYAAIATRDQSAADMEKARRYYEYYVEIAAPDDEYLPKVQAILEQAREPEKRSEPQAVNFTLPPGSHGQVNLEQDIARIAVGDPSVADVSPAGTRGLRIRAASPGKTTILVWFTNGQRQSVLVSVDASAGRSVQDLFDEADRARKAGDWLSALKLAREARLRDPNHVGAGRIVVEAATEAKEAYLRGYQLRETDPAEAIKLFKFVISITDDGDDVHQKAMARVGELDRVDELEDTL